MTLRGQNAKSDIARTSFRSEGNYGCIPGQGLGPQTVKKICQHVDRLGLEQSVKLVVVGRNLHALKQTLLLSFFNAGKSVGDHVKKSITVSFFNRIILHLAIRCRTFH